MARGEIVLQGALREVKRQFGRNTVVVEFGGSDTFVDALVDADVVRVNTRTAHRAELTLTGNAPARRVLDAALSAVDELYRFERVEPPLNEIFVETVGEAEARRMQEQAVAAA
jgi:ABC-2 type transport system ATP-binding protein